MFGNDPKKIQQMMKKLNLNVRQIEAETVIIKAKDKEIIINKPEIMIADMMGKEVYQITGEVYEKTPVDESDISLVMEKTGKSRLEAEIALKKADGDLAEAILSLS